MPEKDTQEISELQFIKGVGPNRAKAFAKEGLTTPRDLLFYFPFSYIDRNTVSSLKTLPVKIRNQEMFTEKSRISDITLRNEVTVIGTVSAAAEKQIGRRRKLFKVELRDGSGGFANLNFWNAIEFFKRMYREGQTLVVSGKPEQDKYGFINFTHPEIEIIDPEDEKLYREGVILPKYRTTEAMKKVGLNMRRMRQIMAAILDHEINNLEEVFPDFLLKKYKLPEIRDTVRNIHFPESPQLLDRAKKRVKFEEILFFEIFLALRQRGIKIIEKGLKVDPKSQTARKLFDSLPFELTSDQKKVIREIAADFESGSPMNRLLQGDVGSGKTIVAVLAMLMAIDDGYQVAFMAPTEILAEQHFNTLNNFLKDMDVQVAQLLGGQKARARREVIEEIETGRANVIVGTHAMFKSDVPYRNLGMIVIDEQHRFGVGQRSELKRLGKASLEEDDAVPHILVMSATPIPRTLSMTLYGDLDVSVIREMPKNRKPVKTRVSFESKLPQIHDFIRDEVKKGRQAYIVYPLVEKSEKLELKAATDHYEYLKEKIFPEFSCGLLHGQMFWYEKDDSMRDFLAKKFQILVATTVIEVGIDIPNAAIMLIENAERFGLSQLHQLRGRVGRGAEQSYCILVTKDNFQYQMKKNLDIEKERKAAVIRLKTMEKTTDGFEISEVDMRLRGPGDMLGKRQSGLPEFKFVDLAADTEIIEAARKEAFSIIEKDAKLQAKGFEEFRKEYMRRFGGEKNYFDVA